MCVCTQAHFLSLQRLMIIFDCLWLQIHKAEAAGESGRQDSCEKVRLQPRRRPLSATVSHFQLLHRLHSASPTSSFPSCPLSLFHFPPGVESAVKATCSLLTLSPCLSAFSRCSRTRREWRRLWSSVASSLTG